MKKIKKIKKVKKVIPKSHGIVVKKQFGQHFLRNEKVVQSMLQAVELDSSSSIFEIGCGDGFLTQEIVKHPFARLWIFEIDPEWAEHVKKMISDKRMTVYEENILDVNFNRLAPYAPWTLLANLPYQVTFPILRALQSNRHLLKEGVIMVQEEVAQKIVASRGRSYSFISLYFQYYFDWQLLDKIKPGSFFPPPKVDSRLLHFVPKNNAPAIDDIEGFWQFIRVCFKQPRRMLRNNLMNSNYDVSHLDDELLSLRGQQMDLDQLIAVWNQVKHTIV